MPPTDPQAEAARWLSFAIEDLAVAELTAAMPGVAPRHACYHAQQAAEKAIKAVFVFLQLQFPFSHDLEELRSRLPDGWQSRANPPGLEVLTQWAVEARYPGDDEPDEADASHAVALAKRVLDVVKADLLAHGYLETA